MLLDCYCWDCVYLTRAEKSDGEGGYTSGWSEGEGFKIYAAPRSSSDGSEGGRETLQSAFFALTPKDTRLSYGDYFKSDGKTYRVTSCPADNGSPVCASFSLLYFTFERKELQDD